MSYKSFQAWKARNPEKYKAMNAVYSKRWRAKNKNRLKDLAGKRSHKQFIKKYGITPEVKAKMWSAQGERCKLCGKPTDKPQLDHCDNPLTLRGVLCITCNTTLGKFNHDPEMFRRMANYSEALGNIPLLDSKDSTREV